MPAKYNCGTIFIINTPKEIKMSVTVPHWIIMVDKSTGHKFSDFLQENNKMIEPTCLKFIKWRQRGQTARLVRFDNDEANFKL